MRKALVTVVVLAIAAGAGYWVLNRATDKTDTRAFSPLGEITIDGSIDVLRATADGSFLVHTNRQRSTVDVIDISDPGMPALAGRIALPGLPTGVAVSPDGQWALATMDFSATEKASAAPRLPGGMAIIDLKEPAKPALTEIIGVGHQPSSIIVASSGADLVAIVAIENKPLMAGDDDATDISLSGNVQVVTFNPARQNNYRVGSLDLSEDRLSEAGLARTDDAQPNFVTLSPDQSIAAATLRENGGIEVFDPYWLETRRLFGTGEHRPNAAAFSSDGKVLFSVDNSAGEQYSVAAWSPEGEPVWHDAGELRAAALGRGLIDPGTGGSAALAISNLTIGRFGATDFAFVMPEAAFVAVYDVSVPAAPQIVQLIAMGDTVTSIASIGSRGLVAMAERDGRVRLYERSGIVKNQ